jgi:GNAT superfamily N-acetyltransferase
MLRIIQVDSEEYTSHVQELFWENLSTTSLKIVSEFNTNININAMLENNMATLHQFAPLAGRLLLAKFEGKIAGCAGLRKIGEGVGEVKRMYVRPEYRRRGIGRALLLAIINEACQIGYSKLRLDAAPFAKEAHALYYSVGFRNTEPYPESEIPQKYHSRWVFMELVIGSG